MAILSRNSKGCKVVPFSIDLQQLYVSPPFDFSQWEERSCKIVILIKFILFCSRSGDEITVQELQLCVNVCVCGWRKEHFLSHFNSHSASITMIQRLCVSLEKSGTFFVGNSYLCEIEKVMVDKDWVSENDTKTTLSVSCIVLSSLVTCNNKDHYQFIFMYWSRRLVHFKVK